LCAKHIVIIWCKNSHNFLCLDILFCLIFVEATESIVENRNLWSPWTKFNW